MVTAASGRAEGPSEALGLTCPAGRIVACLLGSVEGTLPETGRTGAALRGVPVGACRAACGCDGGARPELGGVGDRGPPGPEGPPCGGRYGGAPARKRESVSREARSLMVLAGSVEEMRTCRTQSRLSAV